MPSLLKSRKAKIIAAVISMIGGLIGVQQAEILPASVPILGAAPIDTQYQVISTAKGYVSKPDPTNLPPDVLVAGSQNVIINDQERVQSRAGIELFGEASTTARGVSSDFSWTPSSGSEILVREVNGVLQFFATSTFENLFSKLSTSSPTRFATVWNNQEQEDELLFVSASTSLFAWSGAQGTIQSLTSTTIVLTNEASTTGRFYTRGGEVRVRGDNNEWVVFNYNGVSGRSLTGVTPDPTAEQIRAGQPVIQGVREYFNTPDRGFTNNVIAVLQNQVFFGSQTSQRIFVSSNASSTDFSFSSPRVAGEGALITIDGSVIGFTSPDDEKMIVFSGKDLIYQITFEVSPGSTADREVPRVRPLLTSEGQGALSQELIGKIKQAIVWVSSNKELVELGQVENLPSPQAIAISDPIKPDFADANFTNGEIEFWRNNIVISAPADGKVFVFDVSKRFWQPPQIMGIRRFSVFNDLLYGHSQSVPETYQLFTGTDDNGNPIVFKAHFAYRNSGERARLENFNRFFTELYLQSNTIVTVKILYDWKGAKGITSYELNGADSKFLFTPTADASLGVNPLGTNPLGGLLEAGENTPKYRRFKPIVPTDHFEFQPRFESDSDDGVFQILSSAANVQLSNNIPVNLNQ